MADFGLVLRGRRVITRAGEVARCVAVHDGVVVAIEPYEARLEGDETVDLADDEVLLPGLVDTHVHVNEPGRTEWEGYATATRAAAAGGVTTIVDMPLNSIPRPAQSRRWRSSRRPRRASATSTWASGAAPSRATSTTCAARTTPVVDPRRLYHRNPVTPYAHRPLAGVVRSTWVRGRRVTGDAPQGRLISRGEA
jgi:dihydroorotase-like cyclic amidohydrolase